MNKKDTEATRGQREKGSRYEAERFELIRRTALRWILPRRYMRGEYMGTVLMDEWSVCKGEVFVQKKNADDTWTEFLASWRHI